MSVSSNSSCHSSPLRHQSETREHIYDEPLLKASSPNNSSPTTLNAYHKEICELNKEIETMRMECQKISESNKQELEKCSSPAKMEPLRSPRMVPRMGTRLDYLRQIQAIQQYGQMTSWIRKNQWGGGGALNNGKENCVNGKVTSPSPTSASKPYCVSNVANMDYYPFPPHQTGTNLRLQGGCDTIERELQYSQDRDLYKDTSTTSAYNTGGESCRSTPLTLELHPSYGDDDGGGGYNMSMLSLAVTNGGHTPPSDSEVNFNMDFAQQRHGRNKSKLVSTASHATTSKSGKDSKESSKGKDSSHSKSSTNNNNKSNLSKSPSSSSVSHTTQTPGLPPRRDKLQNLYTQYADVMYTNHANLHHTIMVQQKLFQQQLAKQARQQQQQQQYQYHNNHKHHQQHKEKSSKHRKSHDSTAEKTGKGHTLADHQHSGVKPGVNTSQTSPPKQRSSSSSSKSHQSTASSNSKTVSTFPQQQQNSSENGAANNGTPGQGSSGSDNGNVQMEWVVKLRPDGSRYIARRPIRSKILKERAKKLAQERCGMTTDDDAMSEMKMGRYHRKEDRKRHLEKAKEYKRKKEQLMKQKLESLKESDEQKEPNIIDLSHRKMMKHKNRKMLLDDFVTVQEMLVHGNRIEQPRKATPNNPLLSVTTV